MSTFFWPKVAKKCQKSQKLRFLISTVWKLLTEVEPWSVKSMWPKSATRFGTKLPKRQKSATRCGKMSPKGFQGVSKGSKGFQRVSRGSKGKCYQMWQKNAKGVPRESATRCGKKSPKGFQKLSKVVQLYLLRRTGSNACLRCLSLIHISEPTRPY